MLYFCDYNFCPGPVEPLISTNVMTEVVTPCTVEIVIMHDAGNMFFLRIMTIYAL